MRLLFFLLISLCADNSLSQDTHYWYAPYCAGGFLMPGAMIVSSKDSNVLFYNPALLAHSGKSSISFSGSLYQTERINLVNGAGTDRDLKYQTFDVIPQIISGSFKISAKKHFQIAYALIHDPSIYFQPTQRRDETFNALDDSYSPGAEEFIGQYVYQNTVNEFSGSISSGYALTPQLKIGAVMEAIQRRQTYSAYFTGRALVNTTSDTSFPFVSNDAYYFTQYKIYSLRWKLGMAYDKGNNHFGLLLHSPDVTVYSSGTLLSDNVVVNLRLIPGFPPINFVANTRQENLKIKWKNPLSIAIGYSYSFPRGLIYFSTEYFLQVNSYTILNPRAEFFLRPDTGNSNLLTPDILSLKDARKGIINFSIGLSMNIHEKLAGYFSFRTDFSYAERTLQTDIRSFAPYTSFWNNYHWETGINLKKKEFSVRAGAFIVYGESKNYLQFINFDSPHESNALQGDLTNITAKHLGAGLMLSYIHNL